MDRQLPHNLDSEKIVIGSIISDVNAFSEVSPVLQAEMFYNQFHKELYEEIERQAKKGKIPDLVLLCDKYSGNTTAISNIVDISDHFSVDYYDHALNIQEKFVRRRLWALGSQLASDVYSPKETQELLNSIQRDLSLINQEVASSEVTTLNDAIKDVYRQIETNLKGEDLTGTDTGFSEINKVSGGLQKSDLIIIAGETSQGKALPMDANILTPNGWVKNKDLSVGQEVCSIDGEKSFITGIYYNGIRPMYEIIFADGRRVECSDEHLWEIGSSAFKSGNRVVNTMQLKDMQENSARFVNRMHVPKFSGEFGENKSLVIHPYILGVLIGDGCLTRGLTWCKPDEYIAGKVNSLIKYPHFLKKGSSKGRAETYRIITKRGKPNPMLIELERLGLRNKKSGDRFIPKEYLNLCREQRLELLNGLMDTDGYVDSNGSCYYYSKSKKLAEDVQYLCHSLGYRASLNTKTAKLNGEEYGDFYSVVICADDDREIFTTPIKKHRTRKRRKSNIIIREVNYIGEKECQCISVSHERELYVTDGFIMTHNTSLALSMIDQASKQGEAIAMYSMEMTKVQCAARLLSMNSGVPSNQILFSKLDSNYIEQVDRGTGKIQNLPIYFDDNSTSNIDNIIASIRSMKSKFDISGAVIDYLQILNVNTKSLNKEQAMGDVARRLKNLAKELGIWVIALSQLNRDNFNPVPNLNRLRDSGQIAEAADIVMFVYRPETYGKFFPEPFNQYDTKGKAMIDIAKGRNIGLLKFICDFDAKTTHFKEFTETFQTQETPF